MKATQSPTVPAPRPCAPVPEPCGCGGREETCCDLDCLERPRFFPGQLLEDRDLAALVDWTRDRLGLARYRRGWGVVCGLDVSCDPANPAGVRVGPGYAVSCCGDDVVVCEETAVDLACACFAEDPCAERRPGQETQDHEPRWLDLFLRYREDDAEPRSTLGWKSAGCRDRDGCEHHRVREGFELRWRRAVEGSDPLAAAAAAWLEGFREPLELLAELRNRFPDVASSGQASTDPALGEEIRSWLLSWLDEHPLRYFCAAREALCQVPAADLVEPELLLPTLTYLVLDRRIAYVRCRCHACLDDAGVPLARLCLHCSDAAGEPCPRVVGIDPHPPYRRELGAHCWPAPLGTVNLGRFLWRREEEVCAALRDLGVPTEERPITGIPETLEELREQLDFDPFQVCGQAVCPQTVEPPDVLCLPPGRRLWTFYCADEISVSKSGVGSHGPDGFTVEYQLGVSFLHSQGAELTAVDQLPNNARYLSSDEPVGGGASTRVGASLTWNLGAAQPGVPFHKEWNLTVRAFPRPVSPPADPEVVNRLVLVATFPDGTIQEYSSPEVVTASSSAPLFPTDRADDLTELPAVGEARQKVLREAGVATFEQLAATPADRLRELFPRVADGLLEQWTAAARKKAAERKKEP